MQHDICVFVGSKEMPSIYQIKWRNWTKLLAKDVSLKCLCTFLRQKWVWSVNVSNQYFMQLLYKQGPIYLFWDLRLLLNSYLFSSISTRCSIWLSWMLCLFLQVLSKKIFSEERINISCLHLYENVKNPQTIQLSDWFN